MMEGWVKVHRSILDNPLWQDKPFSKGQAWVDIILLANHTPQKIMLGNSIVEIEAGSFVTSELKLAERWGWSKTKTRAFLKLLQDEQMIDKISDRKKTTINVVNYSRFQSFQTTEKPQKDHEKTAKEPLLIHKQECKNERNNNTSNEVLYAESEKSSSAQYHVIQELYNTVCGSYPRLVKMSEKRKKAIRARMSTGYTVEDFKTLFRKAEASDFLKGKNKRNWRADFDWLICDSNMTKTLEGKYDNEKPAESEEGGYESSSSTRLW